MQLAEVLKLKLNTDPDMDKAFENTSYQYMLACDYISRYVFEHEFQINSAALSKELYRDLRSKFLLKSQMAQSAVRTVTAGYKTVNTQLQKEPYRFQADGKWYSVQRDMRWLTKSLEFHRPQADLVGNRDYSFVHEGREISINTLGRRVICPFTVPDCMKKFLDGSWHFGTAKLVCMKNIWYLHISATKEVPDFTRDDVKQVVGIDRGLRFLETVYDSSHHTSFESGNQILLKRNSFDRVRAQLQAKGTKSAKRTLKRISGRENRWMSDVNHRLSKALVNKYGSGTLYVLEDLEDVSTNEQNFKSAGQTHDLRNWAFYDLETKLTYKAHETGSEVLKVDAHYTSQRCPHCGRICKENRHHNTHIYVCDRCGFQTNDDRVGAMNIWLLGTLWASGTDNPAFTAEAPA
jgi:putative transposase